MNLDNERQWRKIGCFLDETLTIDDITWPEQAERPPSVSLARQFSILSFLESKALISPGQMLRLSGNYGKIPSQSSILGGAFFC